MSQDGINFCQHFGIFYATKGGPCMLTSSLYPIHSRASRMPHIALHHAWSFLASSHQPFSFDLEELRVHLSMTNFCTATVFLTSHVLLATLPIQHGSSEPNMRLSGVRRMAKLSSSAPTMRKSRACIHVAFNNFAFVSLYTRHFQTSVEPAGRYQSIIVDSKHIQDADASHLLACASYYTIDEYFYPLCVLRIEQVAAGRGLKLMMEVMTMLVKQKSKKKQHSSKEKNANRKGKERPFPCFIPVLHVLQC